MRSQFRDLFICWETCVGLPFYGLAERPMIWPTSMLARWRIQPATSEGLYGSDTETVVPAGAYRQS